MSIGLIVTLLLIGVVGALLSGMLGIGGAIVNYPMLLYVPVLFGVGHYTPHQVAGIVALQVLFATLSGVLALLKNKVIHYGLVAHMGASILIGSFVGAYGAKFLPGSSINVIYAVLATIAAVMMFIPKRGVEDIPLNEIQFNVFVAIVAAMVVGMAAGVVGAGGAFILVPIMLQVLKIPTRVTIASSLAITFISSIGASVGKVMAGNIPYEAAIIVVIASVVIAPLGVWVGRQIHAKALRAVLAMLIVATTVKIWFGILA
ncbi:sulfite exporter TauE/SafE family protein [Alicyclobacillus mengziensis]|uniref:Probable membrane transporter protein n=1 Tax=Alicyclobacillus mengziensis TaxID=2931921 RepID=A0A9X7Z960_9BACL|nr:sulfite exporter TauE/SafE family protein [Alicyclobacillus mengziensis]QSO49066.1 sulfite exporter TauE/SafE family protein [Alicyclobacillus mengziensis]